MYIGVVELSLFIYFRDFHEKMLFDYIVLIVNQVYKEVWENSNNSLIPFGEPRVVNKSW